MVINEYVMIGAQVISITGILVSIFKKNWLMFIACSLLLTGSSIILFKPFGLDAFNKQKVPFQVSEYQFSCENVHSVMYPPLIRCENKEVICYIQQRSGIRCQDKK